ncbi:MAG TPA: hypothetical protein VGR47_12150 [Terracidiphilus sp.]|nr:hypothetical protein [Terracidiphilus sp.]
MASSKAVNFTGPRHQSPPLGILAVVYTVLFCAGLYPVTYFGGKPSFPLPWTSAPLIQAFFAQRQAAALWCAFLHFGAAVPLGIFVATAVSRLKFFGIRAAGVDIAFFGGLATAVLMLASSSVLWSMTISGVAQDPILVKALLMFDFGLGGPGFSVPFGLLMAGISVPLLFRRMTPRWIPILGLVLAACGELSWITIEFHSAVALIPLTRFPGFVWMIAVGFALPTRAMRAAGEEVHA